MYVETLDRTVGSKHVSCILEVVFSWLGGVQQIGLVSIVKVKSVLGPRDADLKSVECETISSLLDVIVVQTCPARARGVSIPLYKVAVVEHHGGIGFLAVGVPRFSKRIEGGNYSYGAHVSCDIHAFCAGVPTL